MTETVDEAPSACPKCPNCQSEYSYQVGDLKVCTECAHEWAAAGEAPADAAHLDGISDTDGTTSAAIDPAAVIRDLKDKGTSLVGKVKVPIVVKKG